MSIRVYKLPNLFWDNTTFKVPNSIPDLVGKSVKSSPVMIDFLTGYIDLFGDYNYCKYKGIYYILKKDKPLDINRNHWNYVLVRDFWVNLLAKTKITVFGDVVTWNQDNLLVKHLNKCVPALDNPGELTHLNFDETNYNWREDLEIVKAEEGKFPQVVLSSEVFRWFKGLTSSELVKRYRLADKYLYTERKQLFIFGSVTGTPYYKGWKNRVIELINKSLSDFKDSEKSKGRVISKVNKAGSPLNQLYAITYRQDSIGTGEETQIVKSIDLSTLTDIKPIRWNDLKEILPNKELNETTGIFPIANEQPLGTYNRDLVKLCRKAYLPIKSSNNPDSFLKPYDYQSYQFVEDTLGWSNNPPQKVELINIGKHLNEGELWWVDRLDFVLNWNLDYPKGWFWQAREVKHEGPWPWVTTRSDYYDQQLYKELKEKTPAYGFLLFQIVREPDKWELFEYKGKEDKTFIHWYSGFKQELINKYESHDLFGHNDSNKNVKLNHIAGNWIFSKLQIDLNNFTWLYFAPSDRSYNYAYDYYDIFGTQGFYNYYKKYVIYAVRGDIVDSTGKVVRHNPYTLESYPNFALTRQGLIDEITIKNKLELSRPIKNGDYFFSNQEYNWKEHRENYISWLNTSKEWDSFKPELVYTIVSAYYTSDYKVKNTRDILNLIGDFTNLNLGDEVETDNLNDKVILISNKEGKIEIRTFNTFDHTHYLNSGVEQIVKTVNGETSETLKYYHIHRHGLKSVTIDKEWQNQHTIDLLYQFYKSFGYSVSINQTVDTLTANWLWFDDNDLTSDVGVLFDLVGTPFYAFLRKDKVHLICKQGYTDEIFYSQDFKINKLKKSDALDKLNALPILSKVNQKNVLSIYTQPFNLKTKFLFNQEDSFSIIVQPLKPTLTTTHVNYFLVKAYNDFDFINEWITVSKKPLQTLNVADQIAQDQLTLSIQRAREDYDIAHSRNVDFALEKHRSAFERAEWDLKMQEINSGLNLASSAIGAVAGIGGLTVQSSKFAGAIAKGANPATLSGVGIGLAASAARTPLGITSNIMDLSVRIPEHRRRLEQDREFSAREISYNAFQLDLSHFRKKQDSLLTLNSIANRYERHEINNLELIEQYNKENNLNNVNLKVYTPTKQQLFYLEAYRKENGVDCYIPGVTLEIFAGMPSNIVRMIKIDITQGGIKGITDKLEIDFLINKLNTGVHIVDLSLTSLKPIDQREDVIDVSHYIEQVKEIKKDYLQTKQDLLNSNSKIIELTNALDNEKDERQDDIRKLNKEIEDYKHNLRLADQRLRETAEKAHELQHLLDLCKAIGGGSPEQIKKLQEDLNFANNRIEQDRGKINELEKQLSEKQTKIEELVTKKEELDGQIIELNNKLKENVVYGYTEQQVKQHLNCFASLIGLWFRLGVISDYLNYKPSENFQNAKTWFDLVVARVKSGSNAYYVDYKVFVNNTVLTLFLLNWLGVIISFPSETETLKEVNIKTLKNAGFSDAQITEVFQKFDGLLKTCKLPTPSREITSSTEDKKLKEQLAETIKRKEELDGQVVELTNQLEIAKSTQTVYGYRKEEVETSFYCFLTTLGNWLASGIIDKFRKYKSSHPITHEGQKVNDEFFSVVSIEVLEKKMPDFNDLDVFIRNVNVIAGVMQYIIDWKTNPSQWQNDPNKWKDEAVKIIGVFSGDNTLAVEALNEWQQMEEKCKLPEPKKQTNAEADEELRKQLQIMTAKKEELDGQVVELTNQLAIAQERIKKGADVGGYTLEQIKEHKKEIYEKVRETFENIAKQVWATSWDEVYSNTTVFGDNDDFKRYWLPELINQTLSANAWLSWQDQQTAVRTLRSFLFLLSRVILDKENAGVFQIGTTTFTKGLYKGSEVIDHPTLKKIIQEDLITLPPKHEEMFNYEKKITELEEKITKTDKEHKEEITNLNTQLTQANNRANNLHNSYETANTKAQEQEKLAKLYKDESDKLKEEIGKLKEQNRKLRQRLQKCKDTEGREGK